MDDTEFTTAEQYDRAQATQQSEQHREVTRVVVSAGTAFKMGFFGLLGAVVASIVLIPVWAILWAIIIAVIV